MVRILVSGPIIAVDTQVMTRQYLPTIADGHRLQRSVVGVGLEGLNVSDDAHALDDLAEHDMLAVQVRSVDGGDEKLTTVGVGSSIGHGQQTGTLVLQLKIFIFKLVSINAHTSCAVSILKITTSTIKCCKNFKIHSPTDLES